MKKKATVYFLSTIHGGIVFYIGVTTKALEVRLEAHKYGAKEYFGRTEMNSRKNVFIRQYNFEIKITEIEVVYGSSRLIFDREKYWINEYLKLNPELTNTRGIKLNFLNPTQNQSIPWLNFNLLDLNIHFVRVVNGDRKIIDAKLKQMFPERRHYTKQISGKTKIVRLK